MLSEKTYLVETFKLKAPKPYDKMTRDDLMFSDIVESLLIFGGAIAEPEEVNRTGAQKATLRRLYMAIQEWWENEAPKEPEEAEPDESGRETETNK